jgi:hypothetical protein
VALVGQPCLVVDAVAPIRERDDVEIGCVKGCVVVCLLKLACSIPGELGESDALDQILLSAEAAVVEPSGSSFVPPKTLGWGYEISLARLLRRKPRI